MAKKQNVDSQYVIYAPLNGTVKQLETVPDPTFSEKMVGDGIAIIPEDGEVVAPFTGEVVSVFPTKHAIGLKNDAGVEVLIHIGLETVGLKGEGFQAHVEQGDKVELGQRLITFDLETIKQKAKHIITPIIVTNSKAFSGLEKIAEQKVVRGETPVLSILKQDNSQSSITDDSYQQEAKDIVAAIGGKENIEKMTHCVTRLRFALKDDAKINQAQLDRLDVVKGSFLAGGQFQVIIGQGTVDKVYQAMVKETGITEEATKDDVKQASSNKQNILQRGIKTLADIFIPILPAIVTAGLLMGINNILANPDIFYEGKSFIEVHESWAGLADMINIIANTAFVFLPGLIGWSAVKRFGGNPLLGIVLGLMLVHPDLLNAWAYGEALEKGAIPTWNLFGLEVDKIGYQGQVLPVLFASWILAKIEIFLKRRVADSIQLLVVAPVSLLITGFLTFIIIGPVTFAIGNWITDSLVMIFDNFAVLGGLIYGAIYAPLVITGMHHTFLAVDLQLIGTIGATFLWPILALSNIAQGSATLAMMFVTKDEKLKGLSLTSWISAWLGITEPAMFGVNLRFRYPFIAAITGASIAGAFIMGMHVKAASVGVGGVPGILSIIPGGWTAFLIGMAIVIIFPFVVTLIIGLRKRG
ncbi:MAG TPA: PTS system trehalose-specific EIIBC component [Cerasibacillus sp.]|uniref:PTS system trehalose-specific EIIBC component n=1 Tax=Cerasibacillus sp. TaxID=2498711 RepID=UPI002F407B18